MFSVRDITECSTLDEANLDLSVPSLNRTLTCKKKPNKNQQRTNRRKLSNLKSSKTKLKQVASFLFDILWHRWVAIELLLLSFALNNSWVARMLNSLMSTISFNFFPSTARDSWRYWVFTGRVVRRRCVWFVFGEKDGASGFVGEISGLWVWGGSSACGVWCLRVSKEGFDGVKHCGRLDEEDGGCFGLERWWC